MALWGQAQLIKYLNGTSELKGGTKEDRLAAQEWMSLFLHEAVVGMALGGGIEYARLLPQQPEAEREKSAHDLALFAAVG